MMFIIRTGAGAAVPEMPGLRLKLARPTPEIVKDSAGKTDVFCVGEEGAMTALRDAGWSVVALHDGYYEDGKGGGVAIWGQGRYWEIRDTPLTVREAVGAGGVGTETDAAPAGEHVEVRRAIFGA